MEKGDEAQAMQPGKKGWGNRNGEMGYIYI